MFVFRVLAFATRTGASLFLKNGVAHHPPPPTPQHRGGKPKRVRGTKKKKFLLKIKMVEIFEIIFSEKILRIFAKMLFFY